MMVLPVTAAALTKSSAVFHPAYAFSQYTTTGCSSLPAPRICSLTDITLARTVFGTDAPGEGRDDQNDIPDVSVLRTPDSQL